ncbi:VOC family protein [Gangjinia marincola]|uniref:VOC family protein n=1 Tax=Gangjinia marincola TaxID=578463 RepID=A0ABN1MKP2_9FLAO
MSNMLTPFHLAIPVSELVKSRAFYRDVLGCEEGRSSDHWVDFNFFGHQLVIHLSEQKQLEVKNPVDGKAVPVPHFGVILAWKDFHAFAEDLKQKNINFEIEPHVRFEGKKGEQSTMFFYDPCGNVLEFKTFKDMNQLFEA